jgi:large subunit ribosomal protein L25
MAQAYALKGELRENSGKAVAKRLREVNKLPAIIYGRKTENKKIVVEKKEIDALIRQGGFYSQVCEITLGDKKIQVIPKIFDFHPVTDQPRHVDFFELNEKERVKIKARIKIVNEENCAGVKLGGSVNITNRRIEVLCFPKDILSIRELEVDVEKLNINDSIHTTDLKLPEGVETVSKITQTILTIAGRAAEEVEEEVVDESDAVAGVEVDGEAKVEGEEGKDAKEGKTEGGEEAKKEEKAE